MNRTYLDTNVLIMAYRGKGESYHQAVQVLDDPDRQWVVSDFLVLEVLPKPTFRGEKKELEFMNTFLKKASEYVKCSPEVTQKAIQMASPYDVSPMDALHVGAACIGKVDEFITMEKPTKPLCRVTEISVRSLSSSAIEDC